MTALHALDSGIESSAEIDNIDIDNHKIKDGEFNYIDNFSLCSSCTSSIPKVLIDIKLKDVPQKIGQLFVTVALHFGPK